MEIRVDYSGLGCILLALMCLVLPMNWLFAVLAAAVFHEMCHIMAVILSGGKIYSIEIGMTGAVLEGSVLSPWNELCCILAGPMGSLLLILLMEWIPRTALCGMAQGMFNLLPVYPLDGGRALTCITETAFSRDTAEKVCAAVKWIVFFLIFSVGIWGTFILKLGVMPVFASLFFLSRIMFRKTPCKERNLGVQ